MANQQKTGTSNRGFASKDGEKQREIASQGSKTSHGKGNGHEFNSEEARKVGQKDGQSSLGGLSNS